MLCSSSLKAMYLSHPKMSEADPASQVAAVRPQPGDHCDHWATVHVRHHLPPSQRRLRPHCQIRWWRSLPVHQALHAYVNLSLGRTPDPRWKRRPGRPRCRWIDQIRKDNNDTPPADVWKRAVRRGHGASLRPKLASRWTTTSLHY